MKVVILCGGKGTRLREKTDMIPKPMVSIGGRPILWHIMKIYSSFGFNDFVLALGYKSEVIKQYFLNYREMTNDFVLDLGGNLDIQYQGEDIAENWKITFVDTGEDSMTGSRLARVGKYIQDESFLLTYGDGVADIDLNQLVRIHKEHGRIGTVSGVHMPSRFGKLVINTENGLVERFTEKPFESGTADYINGGFFVFSREFFKYVDSDKSCILEREPLEQLAKDGELAIYRHNGYWQCMDTYRDWLTLEQLWQSGDAPWKPNQRSKTAKTNIESG